MLFRLLLSAEDHPAFMPLMPSLALKIGGLKTPRDFGQPLHLSLRDLSRGDTRRLAPRSIGESVVVMDFICENQRHNEKDIVAVDIALSRKIV